MSSHNEMQIGTHIFRIINRHMDEADDCQHNIMEIMREAFSGDKNEGVRSTTSKHRTKIIGSDTEVIDIESRY